MNLHEELEHILKGVEGHGKYHTSYYDGLVIDPEEGLKRLLTLIRSTVEEVINPCLEYCQEQNGVPYCKNCGLDRAKLNRIMGE